MMGRSSARRDGAIDLVKALAIVAVLTIHCTANHFSNYEVGTHRWLAAAFYGSISRWAVPAFLLCSGALMNDPEREVSLRRLFTRYILRLAAAFMFWAVFYELFRIFTLRGSAPLKELLLGAARNIFYANDYYHLYYFWLAFALYLALPLTRLIVRHGTESEARYILAAWFLCGGVIQTFHYFWPINQMKFSLMYFSMPGAFLCSGLGLLGWYMRKHPPKSCIGGLLLFAAGFAVTMGATCIRSIRAGELDQMFLDGFNLFVLLMAAGVFRVSQWLAGNWKRTPGIVTFLSGASFCVYLVHPFFQYFAIPGRFLEMPVYWAVPLQVLLLLVLSAGTYLLLRRIPVVNRWLI